MASGTTAAVVAIGWIVLGGTPAPASVLAVTCAVAALAGSRAWSARTAG